VFGSQGEIHCYTYPIWHSRSSSATHAHTPASSIYHSNYVDVSNNLWIETVTATLT